MKQLHSSKIMSLLEKYIWLIELMIMCGHGSLSVSSVKLTVLRDK